MNNNFNKMPNQFVGLNNFQPPNQLLMNPNMNLMNQNMNLVNPNINLMNPNMIQMNPNMNLMNPNMNINLGQINPNMIISNMNQINQSMDNLNINNNVENNYNQKIFNENNYNENIEDVLPYIDEPKIILKFSTINSIAKGALITVKLPKSLTKADLYTIAKKYQNDYSSNIILSCNNYLLKNDDSLIDGIKEGSIINIIEDVDFPDGSYYNALMKKNEHYQRIQYIFRLNGKSNVIKFPKNITVKEFKKAALSKLLLNSKSHEINISCNDNSKIINEFPESKVFEIINPHMLQNHWKFGKSLIARTIDEKNYGSIIEIGNLNSINQLIYNIELNYCPNKLKKLIINGKEFLKKEIKNFSLKSIGINDNFHCGVEFEKNEIFY